MTPVVVVDMTPQGAICCDHSLFIQGGSNWASITRGIEPRLHAGSSEKIKIQSSIGHMMHE